MHDFPCAMAIRRLYTTMAGSVTLQSTYVFNPCDARKPTGLTSTQFSEFLYNREKASGAPSWHECESRGYSVAKASRPSQARALVALEAQVGVVDRSLAFAAVALPLRAGESRESGRCCKRSKQGKEGTHAAIWLADAKKVGGMWTASASWRAMEPTESVRKVFTTLDDFKAQGLLRLQRKRDAGELYKEGAGAARNTDRTWNAPIKHAIDGWQAFRMLR
jgi:hypothetical protein